jgi:hypothetical protein
VERVIYLFPGGVEKIVYKNAYFPLQSAKRMAELVCDLLSRGTTVQIGGKGIYAFEEDKSFQAYPFIEVYSQEDIRKYTILRDRQND